MENILIDMFKQFNDQVDGIYFVDRVNKELKFVKDDECDSICPLEEIESAEFANDMIVLKGNGNWNLTTSGPQF